MKWSMNGVEFDGTPAEYMQVQVLLHGGTQTAKQVMDRRGHAVRMTGSAGHEDFKNAALAHAKFQELTGRPIAYSTFAKLCKDKAVVDGIKLEFLSGGMKDGFAPKDADEGQKQQELNLEGAKA